MEASIFSIEPTRKEYHIHFVGASCPRELITEIERLGFYKDIFLTTHQLEATGILSLYNAGILKNAYALNFEAPLLNWTFKICYQGNKASCEHKEGALLLKQVVKKINDYLVHRNTRESYVEIENVRVWEICSDNIFSTDVKLDFSSINTQYLPGRKKADLHLSFPVCTRPAIIELFARTGMYVLVTPTEDTMNNSLPVAKQIILTAQGTVEQIEALAISSFNYLSLCGEIYKGTKLMIETITVFHDADARLPPQVTSIE